jgi:hypothetical protein
MGSLGSASNDSNAHDGNHWVWTRVTEPVLFEFGPCSQGTTNRSNCRSSAKMKMSDLVSKFGGDWQCSASTRSLYCSMTLECNASPRLPSLDTSYCSCHRIYQWMAKKLAMAPNCFQQLESSIFIRTRCTIVSYQFNLTLGQCEWGIGQEHSLWKLFAWDFKKRWRRNCEALWKENALMVADATYFNVLPGQWRRIHVDRPRRSFAFVRSFVVRWRVIVCYHQICKPI